jgi:hypothetical protein
MMSPAGAALAWTLGVDVDVDADEELLELSRALPELQAPTSTSNMTQPTALTPCLNAGLCCTRSQCPIRSGGAPSRRTDTLTRRYRTWSTSAATAAAASACWPGSTCP